MASWWITKYNRASQQDHFHPHYIQDKKKTIRDKPWSFDESILLPQPCQNSKLSSVSIKGCSVLSDSDFEVANKSCSEKKAYPLPRPSGSCKLSMQLDRETVSVSSQSSSGSSSDYGDFGFFRAVEESKSNAGSTGSSPGSKASCVQHQVESPNTKNENMRHPCHPLPLPPITPIQSSKWKKGKLLGRGTFGHVYAGFNSESGQMCAIKEVTIALDDKSSKECLKQLNQEILLLSELQHPNIVQYYGSKLDEDKLSVYLEYVSGGSIHKLLSEYGPFEEPVIRSYTRQIISGIAYLHGRNTVHRDIKGANILVDPNGEIKLADFGMAKNISWCSSGISFKGSPYWMAPEVIMNTNGNSALAVDIWSLGCTVVEMATSKPPWNQFEGVAAIFRIANSKEYPEIPSYLSENAQNFIKLCLQRDPSVRPTAPQLLQHPFIQQQDNQPPLHYG
ncbi:mitogen-activated protein kinase kinase kinase 3-like [Carica papaya]|uniref:mitogen-activated protein kinase kinase kinase 3-like n=1 Tax=Carica papaya TaxID=3649 RepID=UPI000B8CB79C|nr:mitogen-activated protein kinase kinase kinase 3-like [Carica papaya]XP_021902466.1 mitogen-activated protein kinase kinase kinase 3-like [Carica papaya]